MKLRLPVQEVKCGQADTLIEIGHERVCIIRRPSDFSVQAIWHHDRCKLQRIIADMSSPFEDTVASIEKTPVVPEAIAAFTDSEDHFELSFNLLREATQWSVILGGISIGDHPTWNRNHAVVGGHVVRLMKLLRSFMDEVNERREEIAWVVLRMTAECIINLRYLIANYCDALIESFVYQSLQHERDLLEVIATNVTGRGGTVLHIEARIRRSIERTLAASQVSIESIPQKRIRNWGDKNLFQKATALNLGDAYLAIFGGPSRNVHGLWGDLLRLHLEPAGPGQFRPRLNFSKFRQPQPLFALALLTTEALLDYASFLGLQVVDVVGPKLYDLIDRLHLADSLHEEYLQRL
jgi:hypothetical protein